MVFIIILVTNFQILVINNYDGFQQLNFPFSRKKERKCVYRSMITSSLEQNGNKLRKEGKEI